VKRLTLITGLFVVLAYAQATLNGVPWRRQQLVSAVFESDISGYASSARVSAKFSATHATIEIVEYEGSSDSSDEENPEYSGLGSNFWAKYSGDIKNHCMFCICRSHHWFTSEFYTKEKWSGRLQKKLRLFFLVHCRWFLFFPTHASAYGSKLCQ
jgi:hypothetical protein